MAAALLTWSALVPWWWAWSSNRHTTLRPALLWALAAWASWALTAGLRWLAPGWEGFLETYLSLSLTCCAGVAVLGARRPGGNAWHFVVAGLLAVLLLPVLIDRLRQHRPGPLQLHEAQWFFIGTLLLVTVGNYLPTRLGLGAGVCGFGLALAVLRLGGATLPGPLLEAGALGLAASPWLALLACGWPRRGRSELDRTWLAFRDRFGLLWGLRVREQFNRAAANAGWRLALGWRGEYALEAGTCPAPELAQATLRAVLKRFDTAGEAGRDAGDTE